VFTKTLIVNSDGIEVEYFDFSAPRGNMEYSLRAVPRRYRTLHPAFHKVKMLEHMAGVCMRKRRVCWTCSRDNGSKIMKSGERLQGAKRGKMGTGGVTIC